jgi:hypothetical protein
MSYKGVRELHPRVRAFGGSKQNLPAHEVDATVDANKGTGSHIPNQPIVFNWQVADDIAATRLDGGGSSHVRVADPIEAEGG